MPWRFQTPEGIRQIAIPGKLVLDNSEVFTAAGLAGLGCCRGCVSFATYIDSGQLVEVLPDFPAPRRLLSLLYPHRHLSHKVRVLPTGCRSWWRPWTDNRRVAFDSIG